VEKVGAVVCECLTEESEPAVFLRSQKGSWIGRPEMGERVARKINLSEVKTIEELAYEWED